MSDWWTQPSTPARGSAFTPARSASSSRARFINDDADPSAADAPKFLPAFAASPAGKLVMVRAQRSCRVRTDSCLQLATLLM